MTRSPSEAAALWTAHWGKLTREQVEAWVEDCRVAIGRAVRILRELAALAKETTT